MAELSQLMAQYGLALLFGAVLLEQLGAPIPSLPVLVLAGAAAAGGAFPAWLAAALAVAACLPANLAWYWAGRRMGGRILALLCRVSLSPDSCVRQTEGIFGRWGAATLLLAKFLPGLATVAPPVAGALGLTLPRFLAWNLAGALAWAATGVGLGLAFHDQVDEFLRTLDRLGGTALALLAAALAAFVLFRWLERRRLLRRYAATRMGVDELAARLAGADAPLVLDARSAVTRAVDPRRVPGALPVELADFPLLARQLPREREIVIYCNCPNEASAALLAERLAGQGFARVRPLAGGLDAWASAGHGIEQHPAAEPVPA